VAVPLVAPVAANAAMGGALPATTSLRPDLRTATVTNVNTTNVTTTVRFTFNKAVSSLPNASRLQIGTYRQATIGADTATRASDNMSSVDAVFSSTDVDVTQNTHATATFGAVTNVANGMSNLGDSTALVQLAGTSATNSGTAGKSTAPDLTGITVANSTDTINFIFDQNVGASTANPAAFHFNNQAGDVFTGIPALVPAITGNVVSVRFPPGSVASAVRGYVDAGAVAARTTGMDPNATELSVARPGTSGLTNRPDLQSTTLSAGGTTVDFVFDETIAGTPAPGSFFVDLSDASFRAATSAVIVNGNTVRATFAGGDSQNEYFIAADVRDSAGITGVAAPAARTNTAGGLPVGGNAGAFATGFTTGPEALRVTFDNTTGVASILLDQRFFTSNNSFQLIDDTGTQLPATPNSVSGSGGAAGQATVRVAFTPAQLSGARSIGLNGGAVTSFIGASNVVQQLSPTASAAVLSKGSKVKSHKAKGLNSTKQLRAILRSGK